MIENEDENETDKDENIKKKESMIKQRQSQLDVAYKNIEKIKEEMTEYNFLPVDIDIAKVVKYQKKINKDSSGNFAFLNNVFESLNTLKIEGNLNPKIEEEKNVQSKDTIHDQSKNEESQIEEEEEHESILIEEENPILCKVNILKKNLIKELYTSSLYRNDENLFEESDN